MLQRANDFTSLVLKIFAIVLIAILALWVAVSVWGNIAIHNAQAPHTTNPPTVSAAPYQFYITATGQTMYSKSYTMPSKGIYVLTNYYELVKDKWLYRASKVTLDEYYWGKIVFTARQATAAPLNKLR